MSFWSRLRGVFTRREGSEASPPPVEGPAEEKKAAPEEDDRRTAEPIVAPSNVTALVRLGRVGMAEGPDEAEAISLLRQMRGTVSEGEAVSQVLRAVAERAVPETLRVASADILAARGDERGALDALVGISSTPGLLLMADLFASQGQLGRAVATIERVLSRDIDTPGARERHTRWRAALGAAPMAARRLDEATIVTASGAQGPFRLLREVARGGAGSVYEAEDELLGRRVAFKVYHRRGKDRTQLEREASLSCRLLGPGVVRVFDADPSEGWLSLEWVPRGSVRDVLARGDLAALSPIGRWAVPLARALGRMHAAGIVHADVKPANVLLRDVDDPVLSDLGIARPFGAPGEGGSAGYVSPERLAGRASDPRDDVYGYGRILEDVLQKLGSAGGSARELAAWRAFAEVCMGPDEKRPASGAELCAKMPG